jgi:hypothetical protein
MIPGRLFSFFFRLKNINVQKTVKVKLVYQSLHYYFVLSLFIEHIPIH